MGSAGTAADAVAAAFGLGTVRGPWEPVPGGRAHRLWKLRTSAGVWAVKRLNRSREPWWLADHVIAAEIEEVASRCGIAMPRPVPPLRPAAPLLADIPVDGTLASFLVHEWCPGTALPAVDVPPAVLDWVGATLAALHALPVALRLADVPPRETHPAAEWATWLDGDGEFIATVRAYLPDVARATEIVDRAAPLVGRELIPVFTHRDVKPDNVLLAPASPVLVDWDGAGRDVAEWEATRAALAFSRSATGWSADAFARVLRAYEAAGGRRIAPVTASFAGLLATQLGGAAWMLWRALGHRPVTPAERAADHGHTLEILADLRASLGQLDHWASWLRHAHS
jgi:aminoglycoside phosphotransferase (APT) family kinase protein